MEPVGDREQPEPLGMPPKTSNRDEVPHPFLTLGAGVTPAEGSLKPTAGFTFNQGFFLPIFFVARFFERGPEP